MARAKRRRAAKRSAHRRRKTQQHASDTSDEDYELDAEESSCEDEPTVQDEEENEDEEEQVVEKDKEEDQEEDGGDWIETESRLRKGRLVARAEGRSLRGSQERRRCTGEEQKGEFSEDEDEEEQVDEENEDEDQEEDDGDWIESESRLRKGRLVARSEGRSLRGSQKRRICTGEERKGELSLQGLEDGRGKRARRSAAKENCIEIRSSSHDAEGKKIADQKGQKGKGKEKAVSKGDGEHDKPSMQETEVVCGICLIEEGKPERGILDCCDHYFCYTCIMEWAKVESRCPMCKQRFVKIIRPAVAAMGRNRTVRVPLRDQVYVPSEEEVRGFEDPYANIVCMECLEAGEERLLLLCDVCDAAAHTYCVGLGRSVPRGDWFCRFCQVSVPESSSDEDEHLILGFSSDDEDGLIRAIVATPTPVAQRSGRQISAVQPTPLSTRPRRRRRGVRRRLWRRLTRRHSNSATSALRLSQTVRSSVRQTAEPTSSSGPQTSDQQTGTARTVPNQRRLQERIQIIRDNWEEIRRNTRQFPSMGHNLASSSSSLPSSDEKTASSLQPQCRPGDRSYTLGENSTHPTGLCMDSNGCKKEPDIAQAWIMLEHAKAIGEGSSFTGGLKRTDVPFPFHSRQENTGTKQHAVSMTTAPMVLQGSAGVRSHKSVDSRKMNNGYESVVEQGELGGECGKGESAVCNSREDHCDHRKACTADPISKNSAKIRVLECVPAISKEANNFVATSLSRDFEDGNPTNTPFLRESTGSSVHDVGANCSRMQFANAARLNTSRSEIAHGSSLTSQCNLLSLDAAPEVPQVCIEHKCSSGTLHTTVQEADNQNSKELALGHERSELESANTNLGSHTSVSTHHMDAVNKSWKTWGVGSTPSSHEQQQTSQAAHSACENTYGHPSMTEKMGKVKDVKDHVASLVKTELWPIYLSKGLGKEQFKEIARSATHTLLTVCGLELRKPNFLQVKVESCCHRELQAQSPIANFCVNCLKVQVQDVVRMATDRILGLRV